MSKQKKPKYNDSIVAQKKTKQEYDPYAYKSEYPIWRFSYCDKEMWSIKEEKNIYEEIICKLQDLETQTWREIEMASGGKRTGTNSHFIAIKDFCYEARKRILETVAREEEELFSIRLTSKKRLFGILKNGVFNIIWYDQKHEVCPAKKR